MNYAETIEYLFSIRLFGQKLGLETMRELLRQLGNPERNLRFIHIAGTNGKGSVAAMCSSVLATAGYRTGLYTSPHLISLCERFQINGQPITEADVVRLVEKLRPLFEAQQPRPATFFEVVTILALEYFREQKVEVVVWETGLGGRLDATNVITPLVSVITNIAFDHMQYLGVTLEQIAGEKAGIIKPTIPVVTGADGVALDVIRQACADSKSSVTVVSAGENRTLLLGRHQARNCAIAEAALRASGLKITDEQLTDGLAQTSWPGRFQIVRREPVVVLDGAHNAAGAASLVSALGEHFHGKRVALILGVLRDKNYDEMCRILAPLASMIACTRVNSERTNDPNLLADLCRQANPNAIVEAFQDVSAAYMAACEQAEVVVITGSLFLVGEAMNRLGFSDRTATSATELALQ